MRRPARRGAALLPINAPSDQRLRLPADIFAAADPVALIQVKSERFAGRVRCRPPAGLCKPAQKMSRRPVVTSRLVAAGRNPTGCRRSHDRHPLWRAGLRGRNSSPGRRLRPRRNRALPSTLLSPPTGPGDEPVHFLALATDDNGALANAGVDPDSLGRFGGPGRRVAAGFCSPVVSDWTCNASLPNSRLRSDRGRERAGAFSTGACRESSWPGAARGVRGALA